MFANGEYFIMKRQQSLQAFFQPSSKKHVGSSNVSSSLDKQPTHRTEEGSVTSQPISTILEPSTSTGTLPTTRLEPGNIQDGICRCQCCANPMVAYHPTDANILEKTKDRDGNTSRFRQVNSSWFEKFPWLTLCTSANKLYCIYCRQCFLSGTNVIATRQETAFMKEGFGTWRKALAKCKTHDDCAGHKHAVRVAASTTQATMYTQLNTQAMEEAKMHTEGLMHEISSIRYILRQGLAIRGHNEKDGNLYQLMLLRCGDSKPMKEWIDKGDYMSHDVINEIIEIFSNTILRQILMKIHEVTWYCVIVDEATDVTNKEQVSISIRWVDKDTYTIHEDFLGLYHVTRTNSNTLTAVIKDTLVRCGLPLDKCRGQAYDGASNMSGHLTGVATQIKEQVPSALYVHCLAHCLNLCLQDVTSEVTQVRDALGLCKEVAALIAWSPKRMGIFTEKKNEFSPGGKGIKPLCVTRWTVRASAIQVILDNFKALTVALKQVYKEQKDDYGARANGVLSLLKQFSTLFGLRISHFIFSTAESLSLQLQKKDICIEEAIDASHVIVSCLQHKRTEKKFSEFFKELMTEGTKLGIEVPVLPRYKRPPARYNDGAEPVRFENPLVYYRQQYYEALDQAIGELNRRFDQSDLKVPAGIEKCIKNAMCRGNKHKELPPVITQYYSQDLDVEHLKTQLAILPDVVAVAKGEGRKVQGIRGLCSLIADKKFQAMLNQVDILLRLFLTIPVSTATAERSFSAMKRVKTFLRGSMSQQRLNHTMIPHVHTDLTDELDLKMIGKSFITANERRQLYFSPV